MELNSYKKNMKVYLQVLPPQNSYWDNIKIADDNKTIFVRTSQDFSKGSTNLTPNYWKFETDGILNEKNQEDIFNSYIKPSLHLALMGVDILIFAYGQTGSGKSTTINGLLNNFDNRGITPRIITELFLLKDQVKYASKVKFQISFVEIFKNYMIDLINYDNGYKVRSPFKNIYLQNIESEAEGWKYLFQGEGRRKIKKLDEYYSNIGTSVYTIFVKNISKVISNPVENYGKIHIIDMSGIDTYGNTSCLLKDPLDIGSANLNKTVLERCLLIIQEEMKHYKRRVKDPAPLLAYLNGSLCPQSIIIFLGHIRPNKDDIRITISALQFANTVKRVKEAKLKTTIVTSASLAVKDLQNKLTALQEQMYLNSMLKNNDLSFNLTQHRIEQIQHAINDYIKDKANEISVLNVTDAIMALSVFRDICFKLETEKLEAYEKIQTLTSKTKMMGSRQSTSTSRDQRASLRSNKRSSTKEINKKTTSDILSRGSRHSHKHSIASTTTNKETSLSKTAINLMTLLSASFQGDPSKSLMIRNKASSKQSPYRISDTSSKTNEQIYAILNELDMKESEMNNVEIIWNGYKKDMNYNYEKNNNVLEKYMQSTKDLIKQYNILIDALNKKNELIDYKKYDLLKITLYQGISNLQCKAEQDDELRVNETKQRLSNNIVDLMKDSIQIKEEILTLLADLKIMVQEYHRNKKELKSDFCEYCKNTYQIQMPCGDQILESIEDELAEDDTKINEIKDVNLSENLFVKYQNTFKRNRLVNNNLI